jgi:hypothetical protein
MAAKKWILKEIAEVIGVLGVIGTLVFVALEIRQNTNATLTTSIQAISEQSARTNSMLVENSDLRAAYLGGSSQDGLDALSEEQRFQLSMFFAVVMRLQENRFQLHQLDIVDDEDVYAVAGLGPGYSHPAFIAYWQSMRDRYSANFVEWFESELESAAR